MEARIKIAVQKSGRLRDNSLDLLHRCGLRYARSESRLYCAGENMPVDLLLVRDDDIPRMVAEGLCEMGIAGLNVIREHELGSATGEPTLAELRDLEFGYCRLSIAVPASHPWQGIADLAARRIATSYSAILRDFLRRHALEAEVVQLSGAVEIAPSLGQADFICDLVSSGTTLAANDLRETEVVMESQAVLIATRRPLCDQRAEWVERLRRRVDGVVRVRESKYIMLHAPRSAVAEISRLLPGAESPTIVPLDGCENRVAIHAVCLETVFWETLEELKKAGASALLVLPVEKMLA
jgi:ATP phosphoribosyltransferase